jgi:hypothetical protein
MTMGALARKLTLMILTVTLLSGAAFGGVVDIGGDVAYRIVGDVVRISVGRITNESPLESTQSLCLTLRFTADPSPVTAGYDVARASLAAFGKGGRLAPGERLTRIEVEAPCERPPDGTYYVHLMLSQCSDPARVLDRVTFADTVTVLSGAGGGTDHRGRVRGAAQAGGFVR